MKLAAYLSTTTFERYIAFSSLRYQSRLGAFHQHSPALSNYHNTKLRKFWEGTFKYVRCTSSACMNNWCAGTYLYAIHPAVIMNIIPMAPHPTSAHLSNAEDDQ